MKKGCKVTLFNWCYLAQESFKSPVITLVNQDLTNSTFVYSVRKRLGSKTQTFNALVTAQSVTLPELNLPVGNYEHELLWINESSRNVVFQGILTVADKGGSACGCVDEITFEIVTENNTIDVVIEGKGDRGENGWTPCFSFKNFGDKIVKKLIDYDLGTGVKPTLHVNEYVAENGYTTNIENALNFKGDKGEPFTYEDFTPEQIKDLKQPSIDAATLANEATNNANQATLNANNATEQASQATINANQSAQNANDKAQLAEDATTNATNATEQANEATTNANNATEQANEATTNANNATNNAINAINEATQATANANNAASFANAQRGWSPYFIFENDGATRVVKKLDNWIGGTGTKPTDNVGQYVLDGGYTTNKSLATNFKGSLVTASTDILGGVKVGDTMVISSDGTLNVKNLRPIYTYTHSGNRVLKISNIDTSTNTFTSVNHGLDLNVIRENRLGLRFLEINADMPFITYMNKNALYAVNVTKDTFQVSLTPNGSVINLKSVDLNKFHFEVNTIHSRVIDLDGLIDTSKNYRVILDGDVLVSYSSAFGLSPYNNMFYLMTPLFVNVLRYNNIDSMFLYSISRRVKVEQVCYSSEFGIVIENKLTTYNPIQDVTYPTASILNTDLIFYSKEVKKIQTNLRIQNMLLANGTTVKIYEI